MQNKEIRLASRPAGVPTLETFQFADAEVPKPQANEVFAVIKKTEADRLQAQGAAFYDWHKPHGFDGHIGEDEALYRFVTSFATTSDEVDRFGQLIA